MLMPLTDVIKEMKINDLTSNFSILQIVNPNSSSTPFQAGSFFAASFLNWILK